MSRRHAILFRCGRGLAVAFLGVEAASCRGCHDDHPYVPYSIGSADAPREVAADAMGPAAAASSGADAAPPFRDEPAVAAPAALARWPLQGLELVAPDGLVFVSAIVRDFDGDGAADAFALARPPAGGEPGVLAYYRGELADAGPALGAPVVFAPPALFRDATCAPIGRLGAAGRHAVLAELGASCPLHPSSAPDRWVAVVTAGAAGSAPTVRIAATVADPPGATALTIDGEAVDRDADGREDLALRVTIEGGGAPLEPGPRVSAVFAWLDRAAGLSRDPGVTEASFGSLAATAASRATRPREAPAVSGFVAQIRALWRAACSDGGSPRIVGLAGTGSLTCASARALESAGLAEVRAYTTMGDPLRAALALDRAERPPAAKTPARLAEAQRWLASLAPIAIARSVRAISAVPLLSRAHVPAWGALAFEPSGKLLVRTRSGVVRVDADAGDEQDADGVAQWPTAVTSPDGAMRWIETYDPCDGLPLHATFAASNGEDLRDLVLPVSPQLADHCAGARGAPARALPVAWGPAGLQAIVEGDPVLVSPDLAHASALAAFLDQPAVAGAPRSPDGRLLVVPTGAGLLVRGPESARVLRASELEGTYGDLRDCAASNDGGHVACVRDGKPEAKAWVGAWSLP